MPNQLDTMWCHFLDQSYSPFLKPKYETVSTRLFHWLILYPGWRFFLCFEKTTEQSSGTWWPARSLKWLLWYVCGRKQVLARAKSKFLALRICSVFFSARFAFFFEFCVHLKHVHLLAAILLCLCVCWFGRCCAILLAFPTTKPVVKPLYMYWPSVSLLLCVFASLFVSF